MKCDQSAEPHRHAIFVHCLIAEDCQKHEWQPAACCVQREVVAPCDFASLRDVNNPLAEDCQQNERRATPCVSAARRCRPPITRSTTRASRRHVRHTLLSCRRRRAGGRMAASRMLCAAGRLGTLRIRVSHRLPSNRSPRGSGKLRTQKKTLIGGHQIPILRWFPVTLLRFFCRHKFS